MDVDAKAAYGGKMGFPPGLGKVRARSSREQRRSRATGECASGRRKRPARSTRRPLGAALVDGIFPHAAQLGFQIKTRFFGGRKSGETLPTPQRWSLRAEPLGPTAYITAA